ncbi:MAG: hypothetical protein EON54_01670 [Alcaligenaceae bacterium]|nr:MAG: hypothetical protein EON54_01670 [Alcaligenaceae bacterium]
MQLRQQRFHTVGRLQIRRVRRRQYGIAGRLPKAGYEPSNQRVERINSKKFWADAQIVAAMLAIA